MKRLPMSTPAQIAYRRKLVARLGNEQPVTFDSLLEFGRPHGRTVTAHWEKSYMCGNKRPRKMA